MTEEEQIRADERRHWANLSEQMAESFRSGSSGRAHLPEIREKLAELCDWYAENMRDPKLKPAAERAQR